MGNVQRTLKPWIQNWFSPVTRVHINQYLPDFLIRRQFEQTFEGLTVSQEEFVEAMLDLGFTGRETRNGDWVFNISDNDYKKLLWRPNERVNTGTTTG
ncbi:hypothetical protein M5X17_05095 [Paenibacillus alvei]|uniref:hypothetical protein n=1 Tax=Paenibacillus alvei TaxID=44250 RepID=UPI0022817FDC|nr:hypothetical protein [Paenibacillus alvei]MCY9733136.1 hypothetical protein [Paenibacillus alvei]